MAWIMGQVLIYPFTSVIKTCVAYSYSTKPCVVKFRYFIVFGPNGQGPAASSLPHRTPIGQMDSSRQEAFRKVFFV